MSTIDQILERWPLRAMCARFEIRLPDRGKFPSPFRPDQNPSCEVFHAKGKEVIKDWSSGDTFDSIRVFAEVKGIGNKEAIQRLADELPGRKPKIRPSKAELEIPPLHYSTSEVDQIAQVRGLPVAGVDFASFLGTLGFADVFGFPCWILSDAGKHLAEARRMDGKFFPAVGSLGARKAHTFRGSCKSWPLGIKPPGAKVPKKLPVWLVEGGPDYLAACSVLMHSAREFLPVGMLGAGQKIHTEALPFFKGRHVLLLGHPGEAGFAASKTWAEQLKDAGARVRAIQLKGGDLNDLIKIHGVEAVSTHLNREFAND